MTLNSLSGARENDAVQHGDDLVIVVAGDSIEKLRGATVDWSETPLRGGFNVINPNKPPALGALSTLPMLDREVNPASLPTEDTPSSPASRAGPLTCA